MHPATADVLRFFAHDHLPEALRKIAKPVSDLAHAMAEDANLSGAQLTLGLHKLLEAKDCFVRAALPAAPAYPLIKEEK